MSDTYLPLMKGVIAALKADGTVSGLVSTRVYSDVPQDETFPYIVVEIDSEDYSSKTFSGMGHEVRIHAYSRKKSPKEIGDIRDAAYDVIHRQEGSIALDNGVLSHVNFSTGLMFKEPDGVTWHGVSVFNAFIT